MNRQSSFQTTAETQRRRGICSADLPAYGRSAPVPVSHTGSWLEQEAKPALDVSQSSTLRKNERKYDSIVARNWIAARRFRWRLSASLLLCGGFSVAAWLILLALSSANLYAQLPEGPGREETERLCKGCHELERSVSRRQDREGWQATLTKMVAFGTKGTDQEFALILDYLTKNYPAEAVPPVNVNTAAAIEMESRLSLRRSQAAAIIAYRAKNGKFKSIEDLKKVPGLDTAKIEAKKDRIVF